MSLSATTTTSVCVCACVIVLQGSQRRQRFAAACKMVCGMQFVMQPATDPALVAAPSAAAAAASALSALSACCCCTPAFYTAVA